MRIVASNIMVPLKLITIVVLTLILVKWVSNGLDHGGFEPAEHGHFRLIRKL